MDLAITDEAYRNESIRVTHSIIGIAQNLKKVFPKYSAPPTVANVGGFTMVSPFTVKIINGNYQRFAQSLSQIDVEV